MYEKLNLILRYILSTPSEFINLFSDRGDVFFMIALIVIRMLSISFINGLKKKQKKRAEAYLCLVVYAFCSSFIYFKAFFV